MGAVREPLPALSSQADDPRFRPDWLDYAGPDLVIRLDGTRVRDVVTYDVGASDGDVGFIVRAMRDAEGNLLFGGGQVVSCSKGPDGERLWSSDPFEIRFERLEGLVTVSRG